MRFYTWRCIEIYMTWLLRDFISCLLRCNDIIFRYDVLRKIIYACFGTYRRSNI